MLHASGFERMIGSVEPIKRSIMPTIGPDMPIDGRVMPIDRWFDGIVLGTVLHRRGVVRLRPSSVAHDRRDNIISSVFSKSYRALAGNSPAQRFTWVRGESAEHAALRLVSSVVVLTRCIMTTRSIVIRPLTIAEYTALTTGIPKNCPNATFGVAGQTFTAAQAVAFVGTVLTAVSATAAAKTSWKDAKLAEDAIIAKDGATIRGIRDNLALLFSNNTTALADLMITPRKPYTPLSTEARAAAVAKAKATREARGTKGSVQKAAITGNVTGVTITPVVAGASAPASAPAASSAPVASSAPAATPAPVASSTVASTASAPAASAPSNAVPSTGVLPHA